MSSPSKTGEFSGTNTLKTSTRRSVPAYLQKMNLAEKAANDKIIESMQKKMNYLKNPRFRINRPPISFQQEATSTPNNPNNAFRASPEVLTFTDYNVNCIYEIPLTVTNASGVLKRVKYMPPASPQFSVSRVKYPNDETGIIAPGMSAIFYVNFNATSLSDFDDELLVVAEESSFTVKLQARREHPVLTLPEALDCQGCWLGDRVDMVFQFSNKAGEASFKFFCENEEDDKEQDGETLKLKNFTIYPPEFSIKKGEKLELFVCFTPQREGVIEERVILACDNNTSKVYTLRGVANMVELKVTGLNNNPVSHKEELKKLYISDVQPKFPKSSILTIKNETFVKVNYHWVIQNELGLEDEVANFQKKTRYQIEPEKGFFEPNSQKDFKITFESEISMPFYKNVSLVIDDIPIEAIRNPPELIRKQTMERKGSSLVDVQKTRPSITYYEFMLISETQFNKVVVIPPTYFFPTPLLIKKEHQHNFSLLNQSEGPVKYKVKHHSQSSTKISCRVLNEQGIIPAKGEIKLETLIWSDAPAKNQKCIFIVEIENCDPIAFQIGGSFEGPKLKIKQPLINFGLVKTHTSNRYSLEIENFSDIQTEVIFKTQDDRVTFDDYKNSIEPYYQWWDNTIYFEPQYTVLAPNETRSVDIILNSKNAETIDDIIEMLVLNGQAEYLFVKAEVQDIHITLNRFNLSFPELYTGKFYEIREDHDQAIILINDGNIATTFEWPDVIEEDLEAKFEPKSGIIPPKSEIPITLKMIPHFGGKINRIIECNIEGLEVPMGFEFDADVSGLNVVYHVYEESPIATSKVGKKPGLIESLTSLHAKSNRDPKNTTRTSMSLIPKHSPDAIIMKPKIPFEKIDLMDVKINEPKILKFVLKNMSGLSTHFNLYSENFEPREHKIDSLAEFKALQHNSTKLLQTGASSTRKKLTALSPHKNSLVRKKLEASLGHSNNQPLLTGIIEKVENFTSADGKNLNQVRRLERDQKFYLANDKGVALVCDPYQGELKPYEEILINVTIYNDSCGKFEDNLISEIQGLPKVKFPVTLNVSGSPLIVTPNQVGVDYKNDYPLLCLEPRMHSLGVYTKQIKLTNTSPSDMRLDWKLYNLSGSEASGEDMFNIKFEDPTPDSGDLVKLRWEPIPPKEATNGPFKITPMKTVMKARMTETFTISFASNVIGTYNAVSVGESELIREGGEMGKSSKTNPLPFYLKAMTVAPFLTLDKLKRLDGSHLLKFEKWALTPTKKQFRNVVLRNQTPAHLDFTLQIDGPFKLCELKSSALERFEISPVKKDVTIKPETRANLRPEAFLELLIEFEGFNERDHEKWPLCPSMHLPGLIHINYANGDYQCFEMEGILKRPMLQVNTAGFEGQPVDETLDFGVSHINNFVQKTIFLANTSKVPGKWKINYLKYPTKKLLGLATVTQMDLEDAKKTDDPEVFEFSVTEGVVGGKTVAVNKVPEGRAFEGYMTRNFNGISPPNQLGTSRTNMMAMSTSYPNHSEFPMKIMINFKPKKNILYKSKFRITVEEGPSIDIILRGTGSYEEKLEK